jgi:hypothetical protein
MIKVDLETKQNLYLKKFQNRPNKNG